MAKNTPVFSHGSNPAIDPPKFFTSQHDAAQRIAMGTHHRISANAIQECARIARPSHFTPLNSTFSGTWHRTELTWQMYSGAGMSKDYAL